MWWLDCGDHASTLDSFQEHFVSYCYFENGLCMQSLLMLNLTRCFIYDTSPYLLDTTFHILEGSVQSWTDLTIHLFTFSILIRISPITVPWNKKSSTSDVSSSLWTVNQKTSHRKLRLLCVVLEDTIVPNMTWELYCQSPVWPQLHKSPDTLLSAVKRRTLSWQAQISNISAEEDNAVFLSRLPLGIFQYFTSSQPACSPALHLVREDYLFLPCLAPRFCKKLRIKSILLKKIQ